MKKNLNKEIEMNKKLVERFPFLLPRNIWNDTIDESYDYSYTILDAMPSGWIKAFGRNLLEDIRRCLLKANFLNNYRVSQIKEKYGTLRWYDFGVPESISKEFNNIISYYTLLSKKYCLNCGKKTTYVTSGWIEFVCKDCIKGEDKSRLKKISKISLNLKIFKCWLLKIIYGIFLRGKKICKL